MPQENRRIYRKDPAQSSAPRRPAPPPPSDDWQGDWVTPPRPNPPPRRPAPTPEQRRAAARCARARRRRRRQLLFAGTVGGILLASGIITLLLPKTVKGIDPTAIPAAPDIGSAQLVAPLPYGGSQGSTNVQALNWGAVGPVPQTAETGYTYTPAPGKSIVDVPEFGRVTTAWFADAAFLGDSLTEGFCAAEYGIDVGGALICGYKSISPNTIVNRTTVTSPDRGEEVALDVLTAAQPAKLYLLLGTNALVQTGGEQSFLNYYARMLDELSAALPNTRFFVQSILPATQEAAADMPGLAPDHLRPINEQIRALCAERGMYFLDLNAEFSDENGYLLADYAQPDGVHLKVSGYNKWVSYLCTHTPYSKQNPYQQGSTYYLSEDVKQLLNDIP